MDRQAWRRVAPWIGAAVVAVLLVVSRSSGSPEGVPGPLGALGAGYASGPDGAGSLHDKALPGGGVSDGAHCGVKGYHYFPIPAGAHAAGAAALSGAQVPGPQLALLSYGGGEDILIKTGPYQHQWTFQISFGLGSGSTRVLSLAQPLGPQGVAVEIEGPQGLVAGAHGLTADLQGATVGSDHRLHPSGEDGITADLVLPMAAVCPGVNAGEVEAGLTPPIDAHNTITGQPRYTLYVSVDDPAVGALRSAVHAPVAGDTLTGDNLVG